MATEGTYIYVECNHWRSRRQPDLLAALRVAGLCADAFDGWDVCAGFEVIITSAPLPSGVRSQA